jgi:hypothetical protein
MVAPVAVNGVSLSFPVLASFASFADTFAADLSGVAAALVRTRQPWSMFGQTCCSSQGTFCGSAAPMTRTVFVSPPASARTAASSRRCGPNDSEAPISTAATPASVTLAATRASSAWAKIGSWRASTGIPDLNAELPAKVPCVPGPQEWGKRRQLAAEFIRLDGVEVRHTAARAFDDVELDLRFRRLRIAQHGIINCSTRVSNLAAALTETMGAVSGQCRDRRAKSSDLS